MGFAAETARADPPDPTQPYDYVVVGGGTTGLIAANRLANKGYTVAVIERGDYPSGNLSEVPGYNEKWFSPNPPDSKDIVWTWPTVPQVGDDNETTRTHMMGKMMGGSQAFTFVDYFRTTKGAFMNWAEQVGDDSWTWDNVLPYYQRSVYFTPPNSTLRGNNATPEYDLSNLVGDTPGPIELTFPKYAQAFSSWVKMGLKELLVGSNYGFSGGDIKGGSWVVNMINTTDGKRATTYTSYLRAAEDVQDKIDVFNGTQAELINFSTGDSPTASSVHVSRNGSSFDITADKEVILAGGPILTPQLLMVSGVGPKDILTSQNISIILDKPGVGQDYYDHILFGLTHTVEVETTTALLNETRLREACDKFQSNAEGILSSPGPDFVAFTDFPTDLRLNFSKQTIADLATFPSDWPDVGIISYPSGISEGPGENYAEIMAVPMTPMSRGSISLQGGSMADNPVLDPKWLSSQTDLEVAVASLQYLFRLFNTTTMSYILGPSSSAPGVEEATWDDLADLVKKSYRTLNHQSASCRMGRSDDPMAVVDSSGRVMGVNQLRIVDPSAFPFLPPGFPLGTAYMVAEKITDSIIEGDAAGGDHEPRLDL
ncbi:GMC family oxidoreductase [Aspergillus ibericus CBS 121593]|uniref:Alcohol oxidase n=1 Tax=Aspergillus ibericus CBS 121593 TaxID=1448316 RepID=A0A395H3K0_9EURO|nr:alcohol oxidase [Aspergillus ibericus CBS 121593]RAL02481.1 alcohol oxidase [Aspergillus ibericus CBS 121593]